MVKKIVLAILCFATYAVSAQNGTVSPYSFFGVGDLRNTRTVENQSMGGLGMYTDSIHIHLNNPASLGRLGLTAFTAAISHQELRLETNSEKQNSSVSTLEYLSVALPIRSQRAGVGFGLKPFSDIGYSIQGESIDDQGALVTSEFTGEGGLNKVYLSAGFRVIPNLHLGATVNLIFGNIQKSRLQITENVLVATLDRRRSDVSGYDFNYGMTYTPQFGKYTLFSSVRVNTQANLTSENQQDVATIVPETGRIIEIYEVDLDALNLRNTDIKIPTTTSIGLGFGENKHWFSGHGGCEKGGRSPTAAHDHVRP